MWGNNMDKDNIKQALQEVNEVLKIVRATNDKTVKLLDTLHIVDLNLRINAQSLENQVDRDVITEFSLQIQREIANMKTIMNEMLVNRPRLIDAIKIIEKEVE